MNMVFGENGIVEKAEQAKNMTEEASRKEQEGLANAAAYINEVIYGEGSSSGETNGVGEINEQIPDTNSMAANEVEPDVNSIETNTVEPPAVEVPDGEEEGAIVFGGASWSNEEAQVEISTETEYSIEYQINGEEEGSWKTIENNGIVEGLKHGDVVNARLTDGSNHGDYASYTVTDGIAPANAKIEINPTSAMVGDTIKALVNQTDKESGVNAAASKWIFNTNAGEIGTEDSSYVGTAEGTYGTFTKNEEELQIKARAEGEYYLHVLTVDKAGNKKETISEKVEVRKVSAGDINIVGPTWDDEGNASVEIEVTDPDVDIEYKVNDGEWEDYTGPIEGLENGDKITVRPNNNGETGDEVEFEIKDETKPEVEITVENKDTSTIEISVDVTDDETGMKDEITYTYYIKKEGEPDSSYQEVDSNTTGKYTFEGLEQGTGYDIKVVVDGDKAGNKGEAVLSNQSTSTLPGGEEGSTSGAIVFGKVSWASEKASIEVSTNTEYRMQYQINGTEEDAWKEVNLGEESSGTRSGSITNLSHNDTVYVRLTDGTNYGEPTNTTIKDTINPAEAQISLSATSAIAGQTITARVTHIDNES